jgi:hypothetical protein
VNDLLIHGGDKIGNGGEMRPGIGAQGHENDVLLARLGYPPAGDDPSGIRKENDLQQYARIIGGSTGFFVLIALVKKGKIKLVVDEMIQGVFKSTGEDLFLEMDGDEFTLSV